MNLFRNNRGEGELVVLFAVIVLFSILIAGGIFPKKFTPPPPESDQTSTITTSCCDNAECNPTTTGKTITYNEAIYGRLKSQVSFSEQVYHLEDTTEVAPDPEGGPIIKNTSNTYWHRCPSNHAENEDQIWGGPGGCTSIKNDMLIYVCRENCVSDPSLLATCAMYANVSCYGSANSIYDVYFRLSDYPTPGVPDVIRKCPGASQQTLPVTKKELVEPPVEPGKPNLQLRRFEIITRTVNPAGTSWVSPWCKPAIYLYPPEKTNITVAVKPQGNMTLSIPLYPLTGWHVTAYPTGRIDHLANSFDYLYYEAQIPDKIIEKPKEGFVVEQIKLKSLFDNLLPKLGLNKKESLQFSEYWLGALPKSPYFFVGIVSTHNLNTIAPLSIHPKPDNIIRVTLYFEALDKPAPVIAPTLLPISRDGFTAVEWGGIVKTHRDQPFSCFM